MGLSYHVGKGSVCIYLTVFLAIHKSKTKLWNSFSSLDVFSGFSAVLTWASSSPSCCNAQMMLCLKTHSAVPLEPSNTIFYFHWSLCLLKVLHYPYHSYLIWLNWASCFKGGSSSIFQSLLEHLMVRYHNAGLKLPKVKKKCKISAKYLQSIEKTKSNVFCLGKRFTTAVTTFIQGTSQ